MTPEEDAALDRLLEPLRQRRRELEPVNAHLSLEELEAYALEPQVLVPERRELLEACCLYFTDTRLIVEALRNPDPCLSAAIQRGYERAMRKANGSGHEQAGEAKGHAQGDERHTGERHAEGRQGEDYDGQKTQDIPEVGHDDLRPPE